MTTSEYGGEGQEREHDCGADDRERQSDDEGVEPENHSGDDGTEAGSAEGDEHEEEIDDGEQDTDMETGDGQDVGSSAGGERRAERGGQKTAVAEEHGADESGIVRRDAGPTELTRDERLTRGGDRREAKNGRLGERD